MKKVTERTILRRNTQLADFCRTSYKERLKKAIAEQPRAAVKVVNPLHREVPNHINGGTATLINKGKGVLDETTLVGGKQSDDDGWTEVRRKKKNTQPKLGQTSSQQWRKNLLAQGKCFNCLLKGHRKFQCTRKIKCLKCNTYGHISNMCESFVRINGETETLSNKQTIRGNTTQRPPHKPKVILLEKIQRANNNSQKEQVKNREIDHLANYETMPLINPSYFATHRPTDRRVFLTKSENLLPANDFLERSAIVLTGPNQNTPTLAYRIMRKLAALFRMNPQHLKVRKVSPAMGDYQSIFPNVDLRNEACNICAFDLGSGVQIQLARWVKKSGMVHDPTTHKARLRIDDLPTEYWTMEALTELVSGFGRLERMSDFPANEKYEEIRVLVACYHPMHVFDDIMVSDDPFSSTVHFKIEGWLISSAIQPPQSNTYQGGHRQQDEGEDDADYWEEECQDKHRIKNKKYSSDSSSSSGPVTQFKLQKEHLQRNITKDQQMETRVAVKNGDETATKEIF